MKLKQASAYTRLTLTSLMALFAASCHEDQPNTASLTDQSSPKKLEEMLSQSMDPDKRAAILEGVRALKEQDYKTASRIFNSALLDDPKNSGLHTLNAITYQLRAKHGDMGAYDLADAGYTQAKVNNPNNLFACIQLGRVKAEKKDYLAAQEEFAEALLMDPNNQDALYELASVSYLMGDMKTAGTSVDRLLSAEPDRPEYVRAGALIYAALGQKERAQQLMATYKTVEEDGNQTQFLEQRLNDWQHLHSTGNILLAQADTNSPNFDTGQPLTTLVSSPDPAATPPAQEGTPPAPPGQTAVTSPATPPAPSAGPTTPAATPPAPKAANNSPAGSSKQELPQTIYSNFMKDDMVVIDGVVMTVSESGTTSKGNNILENFTASLAPYTKLRASHVSQPITTPSILQGFTGTQSSSPAPSFTASGPATSINPFGPNNKVKVFAKGLTLNTITYSLNIVNAAKENIEVIGRPTLTTQIGKAAEFFSGEDVKIAIAGNFGGNVTQTPVGNTLKVTPISLENGYVTLDVELIGSLLTQSTDRLQDLAEANTPIVFTINRSNVKTTIKVKLGETIFLAGTAERLEVNSTNGVPFLDQIPGIQYLFSNQSTISERKSVMYLITPRSYKANLRETNQYFNRGEEEECRPNLSDLERRYKNWFNPHLNHILILKGLGPVYRDFRAGDFLPLQWLQTTTLEEQVTKLVDFLWY